MLWGGIFPDLNNGVRNLIWRGGGPNIFTIVEIGKKKKKLLMQKESNASMKWFLKIL